MTRVQAFTRHLVLSVLVIGTVATGAVTIWYPLEYAGLSGAYRLMGIVAACDVVVGPLLTLLVYKQGKPRLKLDMSIIVAVQAAFFLYGMHVAWNARPVYFVAAIDRFELIVANAVRDATALPKLGPETVGAKIPDDPALQSQLVVEGFQGKDLAQQPRFYVPLPDVIDDVVAKGGRPLSEFARQLPPGERELLARAVDEAQWPQYSAVPATGPQGSATVLVAKGGGDLHIVDIDPWR